MTIKRHITKALVVLPLVVPTILISCSTKSTLEEESLQGFSSIEAVSTQSNVVQKANDANLLDKHYGINRNDYFDGSGSVELNSFINRVNTGVPLAPSSQIQDLWNWTPQSFTNGEVTSELKQDYKNWNNPYPNTKVPKLQRLYSDIDGKFNRASVVAPRERIFGQQLKDSQSIFAQFTPSDIAKDVGEKLGFVKGDTVTNKTHIGSDFLPYSSVFGWWSPSYNLGLHDVNWPSGETIDRYHRQGVPILGNIFLANNSFEQGGQVLTNPGPKKDYPVAKGLVELARYYGLDGWWIDYEQSYRLHDVSEFMKALSSYSKVDEYTSTDGVTHKLNVENSHIRRQKSYGVGKQLIVGSYVNGYGGLDGVNDYIQYADYFFNWQRHASDTHRIKAYWESAHAHNKDRYYYNGASNWPEEGQNVTLSNNGAYYDQGVSQNVSTSKMNPFSLWWYSMFYTGQKTSEEYYSSFAGDPRAKDIKSKWSTSNSFREQTTIIGRNPWGTNFSTGKGRELFLGSHQSASGYTIGTSELGWKNISLSDYLPTYKWIMDYYDGKGANITNLSLNQEGKLTRPVVPFLDQKTNLAFYGGTALKYKGRMPVGNSFVNRLYASNINVESGDKFTIKIANSWKQLANNSSRIIPDLALGVVDHYNQPDYYLSNGTEDDPLADDPKYKLGFTSSPSEPWGWRSNLLRYKKDIMSPMKRSETIIKPTTIVEDGDYIDITYDISPLNGKAIADFGIKATNTMSPDNINNLSLLQMRYIPHEYTATRRTLESVSTDKIFTDNFSSFKNARISWKTSQGGIHDAPIKNYLVYYLGKSMNREKLAWVGNNPAAHLKYLYKEFSSKKIEIIALDELYNVVLDDQLDIQT